MSDSDFISQHILGSVHAAVAEANGFEEEARRLNAQVKLRLVMMSDEDILRLARMTATPPKRPVEKVADEIRQAIEKYRATVEEWIFDVYGPSFGWDNDSGTGNYIPDDLTDMRWPFRYPES